MDNKSVLVFFTFAILFLAGCFSYEKVRDYTDIPNNLNVEDSCTGGVCNNSFKCDSPECTFFMKGKEIEERIYSCSPTIKDYNNDPAGTQYNTKYGDSCRKLPYGSDDVCLHYKCPDVYTYRIRERYYTEDYGINDYHNDYGAIRTLIPFNSEIYLNTESDKHPGNGFINTDSGCRSTNAVSSKYKSSNYKIEFDSNKDGVTFAYKEGKYNNYRITTYGRGAFYPYKSKCEADMPLKYPFNGGRYKYNPILLNNEGDVFSENNVLFSLKNNFSFIEEGRVPYVIDRSSHSQPETDMGLSPSGSIGFDQTTWKTLDNLNGFCSGLEPCVEIDRQTVECGSNKDTYYEICQCTCDSHLRDVEWVCTRPNNPQQYFYQKCEVNIKDNLQGGYFSHVHNGSASLLKNIIENESMDLPYFMLGQGSSYEDYVVANDLCKIGGKFGKKIIYLGRHLFKSFDPVQVIKGFPLCIDNPTDQDYLPKIDGSAMDKPVFNHSMECYDIDNLGVGEHLLGVEGDSKEYIKLIVDDMVDKKDLLSYINGDLYQYYYKGVYLLPAEFISGEFKDTVSLQCNKFAGDFCIHDDESNNNPVRNRRIPPGQGRRSKFAHVMDVDINGNLHELYVNSTGLKHFNYLGHEFDAVIYDSNVEELTIIPNNANAPEFREKGMLLKGSKLCIANLYPSSQLNVSLYYYGESKQYVPINSEITSYGLKCCFDIDAPGRYVLNIDNSEEKAYILKLPKSIFGLISMDDINFNPKLLSVDKNDFVCVVNPYGDKRNVAVDDEEFVISPGGSKCSYEWASENGKEVEVKDLDTGGVAKIVVGSTAFNIDIRNGKMFPRGNNIINSNSGKVCFYNHDNYDLKIKGPVKYNSKLFSFLEVNSQPITITKLSEQCIASSGKGVYYFVSESDDRLLYAHAGENELYIAKAMQVPNQFEPSLPPADSEGYGQISIHNLDDNAYLLVDVIYLTENSPDIMNIKTPHLLLIPLDISPSQKLYRLKVDGNLHTFYTNSSYILNLSEGKHLLEYKYYNGSVLITKNITLFISIPLIIEGSNPHLKLKRGENKYNLKTAFRLNYGLYDAKNGSLLGQVIIKPKSKLSDITIENIEKSVSGNLDFAAIEFDQSDLIDETFINNLKNLLYKYDAIPLIFYSRAGRHVVELKDPNYDVNYTFPMGSTVHITLGDELTWADITTDPPGYHGRSTIILQSGGIGDDGTVEYDINKNGVHRKIKIIPAANVREIINFSYTPLKVEGDSPYNGIRVFNLAEEPRAIMLRPYRGCDYLPLQEGGAEEPRAIMLRPYYLDDKLYSLNSNSEYSFELLNAEHGMSKIASVSLLNGAHSQSNCDQNIDHPCNHDTFIYSNGISSASPDFLKIKLLANDGYYTDLSKMYLTREQFENNRGQFGDLVINLDKIMILPDSYSAVNNIIKRTIDPVYTPDVNLSFVREYRLFANEDVPWGMSYGKEVYGRDKFTLLLRAIKKQDSGFCSNGRCGARGFMFADHNYNLLPAYYMINPSDSQPHIFGQAIRNADYKYWGYTGCGMTSGFDFYVPFNSSMAKPHELAYAKPYLLTHHNGISENQATGLVINDEYQVYPYLIGNVPYYDINKLGYDKLSNLYFLTGNIFDYKGYLKIEPSRFPLYNSEFILDGVTLRFIDDFHTIEDSNLRDDVLRENIYCGIYKPQALATVPSAPHSEWISSASNCNYYSYCDSKIREGNKKDKCISSNNAHKTVVFDYKNTYFTDYNGIIPFFYFQGENMPINAEGLVDFIDGEYVLDIPYDCASNNLNYNYSVNTVEKERAITIRSFRSAFLFALNDIRPTAELTWGYQANDIIYPSEGYAITPTFKIKTPSNRKYVLAFGKSTFNGYSNLLGANSELYIPHEDLDSHGRLGVYEAPYFRYNNNGNIATHYSPFYTEAFGKSIDELIMGYVNYYVPIGNYNNKYYVNYTLLDDETPLRLYLYNFSLSNNRKSYSMNWNDVLIFNNTGNETVVFYVSKVDSCSSGDNEILKVRSRQVNLVGDLANDGVAEVEYNNSFLNPDSVKAYLDKIASQQGSGIERYEVNPGEALYVLASDQQTINIGQNDKLAMLYDVGLFVIYEPESGTKMMFNVFKDENYEVKLTINPFNPDSLTVLQDSSVCIRNMDDVTRSLGVGHGASRQIFDINAGSMKCFDADNEITDVLTSASLSITTGVGRPGEQDLELYHNITKKIVELKVPEEYLKFDEYSLFKNAVPTIIGGEVLDYKNIIAGVLNEDAHQNTNHMLPPHLSLLKEYKDYLITIEKTCREDAKDSCNKNLNLEGNRTFGTPIAAYYLYKLETGQVSTNVKCCNYYEDGEWKHSFVFPDNNGAYSECQNQGSLEDVCYLSNNVDIDRCISAVPILFEFNQTIGLNAQEVVQLKRQLRLFKNELDDEFEDNNYGELGMFVFIVLIDDPGIAHRNDCKWENYFDEIYNLSGFIATNLSTPVMLLVGINRMEDEQQSCWSDKDIVDIVDNLYDYEFANMMEHGIIGYAPYCLVDGKCQPLGTGVVKADYGLYYSYDPANFDLSDIVIGDDIIGNIGNGGLGGSGLGGLGGSSLGGLGGSSLGGTGGSDTGGDSQGSEFSGENETSPADYIISNAKRKDPLGLKWFERCGGYLKGDDIRYYITYSEKDIQSGQSSYHCNPATFSAVMRKYLDEKEKGVTYD